LAQQLNSRARRLNPNNEEKSLANSFRQFMRNQPDHLEIVQEYLRAITPSFDRVDVEEAAGELRLSFIEKSGSHEAVPFYLNQASSGIVNSAEIFLELFRLPEEDKPAGLLIIEEPEAHLHPGAIQVVKDACLEASKFRQVLVTTHSPELLDDPSMPPDWIRVVYKDENGTHVEALDSRTDSIIRDHLYTAGQLLRQGGLIHRS
jgi:predicted ATPase